ncbi:hypothetical protein [Virgibacillus sp. 6R]|uniref:hypothetical protein n=1 Tax=Virgibacillus sp. 6R TaxID=1911587 RepID=UPI0012EC31B8|nr:hypothetical protein [Virgibacillus sp. 6R]MBS7429360.1 hypothetical protein [Virgibacillus sp. 19R1-5]
MEILYHKFSSFLMIIPPEDKILQGDVFDTKSVEDMQSKGIGFAVFFTFPSKVG